jgi:hypothetical protein
MNHDIEDEFDRIADDGLNAARGIVWSTLGVIVVGLIAWWALA